MNKQTVHDLISVVSKSTDKNVIYKALFKLRTDLVKDKEGIELFYSCEGVPPLVRLISKPYEKILEIALSILANCCIHKDCCKQVFYRVAHKIVCFVFWKNYNSHTGNRERCGTTLVDDTEEYPEF